MNVYYYIYRGRPDVTQQEQKQPKIMKAETGIVEELMVKMKIFFLKFSKWVNGDYIHMQWQGFF